MNKRFTDPYTFEGRIPLKQAIPLGLQHVMAMFVGNLTPLIIVMGVCGMVGNDFEALRISLLQNAMIMAGVVTLIQMYAIGPIGGKVPVVMGTSSGFLGIMKSISAAMGGGVFGYGAILGASIVGGLMEGVLGLFLKPLRRFFPPVVTGSVVMAIGLSLIGVGMGYYGGGTANPDFGSAINLFLGTFVLIVIIITKHFGKGFVSSASVLIGIIAGYVLATILSAVLPTTGVDANGAEYTYSWVVQWNKVASAGWIEVPKILPVKPVFQMKAIIPMMIMFVVTAVETIGDISAVQIGGIGREASDKELAGGVICDGVGSSLAALFGVLPNTSFSQNVGLVSMTKVVNRFALSVGAVFLILCGFCPKLGAVVNIMPQSVLGGAAIMMFASIIVGGISLITNHGVDSRITTIVAVSVGLGYGIGTNSAILEGLHPYLNLVFGESGIVPTAIIAILLNVVLPKDEKEE
ncbi:nucleobase:cation symporter-2, NCS2 family [[Clostridium] aminophilum]|uniref:Nucleobase:cation symporter-2, NCS2 family n=1 Tax=[Clostridium] aminophilum TaxID=1526 RepID=A0A1I0GJU3_9FIRM|nr:solute carrier family 23 protein [[Clostridium] aminophilum]SET70319.1 nucleobase:cation symporter-2, NCS2 family [[Clostridium] aminophilum]